VPNSLLISPYLARPRVDIPGTNGGDGAIVCAANWRWAGFGGALKRHFRRKHIKLLLVAEARLVDENGGVFDGLVNTSDHPLAMGFDDLPATRRG
jgi:hypothetical protein